ncbi:MAG: Rne/Rng family ribonuclease [Eubacteriales bacterium]
MNRMIIDSMYSQIQVVIMHGNDLEYYFIEKETDWNNYGDIYMGRVEQIKPGIQGAFINIGQEKNALLHVADIITNPEELPIDKILKQGQELVVQIKKEAVGEKGGRLTTKFSISGHFLVLLPTENKIFISKKIKDEEEEKRLKKGLDKIKPQDCGMIIRTEAMGVAMETLQREFMHLFKSWKKINQIEKAPKLLFKDENIVFKSVRDYYSNQLDEIVVNDPNIIEDLKEYFNVYFPGDIPKIKYQPDENLLESYHVNHKIDQLCNRKIWLKSGGHIVIDYTEAFTVIDVNSGKFTGNKNLNETVLKINLEATDVIANQIRLRNISGIILVDYINVEREKDQKMILQRWTQLLTKDKVKTKIVGFTQLCILQITRKQQGKSLHKLNYEGCHLCEGTGLIPTQETLFYQCLKLVEHQKQFIENKKVTVKVSPFLRSVIREIETYNNQYTFIQMLYDIYKIKIVLEEDAFLKGTEIKVAP